MAVIAGKCNGYGISGNLSLTKPWGYRGNLRQTGGVREKFSLTTYAQWHIIAVVYDVFCTHKKNCVAILGAKNVGEGGVGMESDFSLTYDLAA